MSDTPKSFLELDDGMSVNIRRELSPESVNGVPLMRVLESNKRISDSLATVSSLWVDWSLTVAMKSASGVHCACHFFATWRWATEDSSPMLLNHVPLASCFAVAPGATWNPPALVKTEVLGWTLTGTSSSSRNDLGVSDIVIGFLFKRIWYWILSPVYKVCHNYLKKDSRCQDYHNNLYLSRK